MKPLVFCAFPPCWYVDVCRFVSEMTKQLLVFETGKRRQEGAKILSESQSLCFNAPPPILIWTLPNLPVAPHGLTQSSEQRRSFSSKGRVYFYVQYVFHTWTGEKVPDLFCVWSLFFPAQTCWELFWRFLHLMQSEQSDVQVRRAAVGLCFVALVASVTVSHRFRWTNSELYISSLSWYWT